MINKELYNIASFCAAESNYLNIVFDKDCGPINRYDILEYTSSGAFVSILAKKNALWPASTDESFNAESLYIVESVEQIKGQSKATLINWSFGGEIIKGVNSVQDVVITDSLMERLPKRFSNNDKDSLIQWLNAEFLFKLDDDESMFFRIIGGEGNLDGFWLGRNWLVKVVAKRIGQKDYLVIEKLQRSPQKVLNVQRGCAKLRFIEEKNAVEANPIFKTQFALGSSDPNSIINLWKRYNETDESILKRLQEVSGVLRIENIIKKDGKICAKIQNSEENIENFKDAYESMKNDYSISASTPSIKGELPLKNVIFNSKQRVISWEWNDRLPHEKITEAEIKIDFKSWAVQSKRRKEALDAIQSRNIPIPAITDLELVFIIV